MGLNDAFSVESLAGTELLTVDQSGNTNLNGTLAVGGATTFSGAQTDANGGTVLGSQLVSVDDGDSPYSIGAYTQTLAVDTTSDAVTVNLPALASVPVNTEILIYDSADNADTNNITVGADGAETFVGLDGAAVSDPVTIDFDSGWILFKRSPLHWIVVGSKLVT